MSVFKMEFLKLYKRKSTKVLMSIYGLMMILLFIVYFLGENQLGLKIFSGGQFLSATLSLMMSVILPFICLYISSVSFALDFTNGTIKNMFLLPIKKSDIFLAKIISVQSLIGLLLVIQFSISLLFGLLLDGGFSISYLIIYFLEYLGAFFVLGIVNLSGVLFSLLVSSTGLALLLSYLVYIGMGIISSFVPVLKTISVSNIITNYSIILSKFSISLLLSVVAYYIILFIIGSLVFEKKEESLCQFE